MPKKWTFHPPRLQEQREIEKRLGISNLAARVLVNRGLNSPDEASSFLSPKLAHLNSPDDFADMERACERILQAVERQERILIFGDYDVDGVAGTSLLVHLFRVLRTDVEFTVPNRLTESYSISESAAQRVIQSGADLVITVDNGTTAFRGIDMLTRAGIDVVVTDHHLPGDEMPNAFAVVNPQRKDCQYPFKYLCGTGVAFKLAWALGCTLSGHKRVSPEFRDFLLNATAWTALGTVADLVPLVGENRVLAKFGLAALARSTSPGVRALCELCGIRPDQDEVHAEDIAFRLAPRLNAAGRMGQADIALQCLTARTEAQGLTQARLLEDLNRDRREIERDIYEEANQQAENEFRDHSILVLAGQGWSAGVIGIVASRLVQKYDKPAILIALDGAKGKGSARTIPGFHLHDALGQCHEHLLSWGGHAMAAGMEIEATNIEVFREQMNSLALSSSSAGKQSTLSIDAEVPLSVLTTGTIREIEQLGPFGQGHPRPVFASEPVELANPPRPVGAGRHLQLQLKQGSRVLKAIAYGMGDQADKIASASRLGFAYTPTISTFRGYPSVELQVLDFRTEVDEVSAT